MACWDVIFRMLIKNFGLCTLAMAFVAIGCAAQAKVLLHDGAIGEVLPVYPFGPAKGRGRIPL